MLGRVNGPEVDLFSKSISGFLWSFYTRLLFWLGIVSRLMLSHLCQQYNYSSLAVFIHQYHVYQIDLLCLI